MRTVGFTGTREGMTIDQKETLIYLLKANKKNNHRNEFHFGLCLGADEEAALIAERLGYVTVAHPSDRPQWTSDFVPDEYAQAPKPPLERNPDIVRASEILFAAPSGFVEVRRSGTWATIREARRTNTPLYIIWPDGHYSVT
jgi:hypothetical protein